MRKTVSVLAVLVVCAGFLGAAFFTNLEGAACGTAEHERGYWIVEGVPVALPRNDARDNPWVKAGIQNGHFGI